MSTTITEKLYKFQEICNEKVLKIKELEAIWLQNQSVIAEYNAHPEEFMTTATLNLQLAELELQSVRTRSDMEHQRVYLKELQELSDDTNDELAEAIEMYDSTVKSIPIYKQQLASHVTILHDFVSTLRESYSMLREETRTYQSLVHQLSADKSDESDRRLEWLQKLVAVTTIQSKEAERMMMMGK